MKFKLLLVGIATHLMAATAAAQPSVQAPASQFSPAAFRAHVTFLADDLLEGRESGTRGYDIAARYVATQFEALGLSPGAGDSWFQPVQFVRFQTSPSATLTVGDARYSHGRELIVRASADTSAFAAEAPLVFAGYGLDLPSRGYQDYAGLDVRGKIVVVLSGYPAGTASDVGAHLVSEKARMAAARGAVGLLTVRAEAEAERLPWQRLVANADRPGTTWLDEEGRPFSSHGLRFVATVDRPLAEALFTGAPRSLAAIMEQVEQGGRPAGFALARTARAERGTTQSTGFISANVVAVLPGTDPALAGEYVLMMAHLDGLGAHAGQGAQEGADIIRNGAMDNATGVATLIEVARQMSRPGNRPRRPILFAAVTAEEVGLLGSEFLARNPATEGRIIAVVNLDMPILTYDFEDVIAFGAEHSTLGPIVERAARRMNVRLSPDPLPEQGLFTRSDHYGFVRIGVPSVFLMTGFAGEGRERFTHFLEEEYHSPADDLLLPFNWTAGARFAQLNYLIAREIAESPEAPLWYADSVFGDVVAAQQRRAQRPAAGASEAAQRAR